MTIFDADDNAFLILLNNYRISNGLQPVSIDSTLQDAANWMSNDLLTHCVTGNYACSHIDSLGRDPGARMLVFGYPSNTTAWGEIIAWGYGGWGTPQDAFNSWRNSPGHNAIMLGSSYVAVGISHSCNITGCAWITDFGSRMTKPLLTITATNITLVQSSSPCLVGTCSISTTVTWINNGSSPGIFIPNITIDGIPSATPLPSESLAAGASITHIFTITGLTVGIHTICPLPN